MDLLKLIKSKCAIRKYKDKPIRSRDIGKIIEGGKWSSSVLGVQPWLFVIITDKKIIVRISDILSQRCERLDFKFSFVMRKAASIIRNAPAVIAIYNSGILVSKFSGLFPLKEQDVDIIKLTEAQAIAGAIQNMALVAESLGIGSCWLTLPLFYKAEVEKILNTKGGLFAFLTLGYSAEESKRALRDSDSKTIKYIK